MKSITRNLLLALSLFVVLLPASADTAKVKIGKISAKINTNKENNSVTISQAGDTLIVGYTFSKTRIAGLNTKSSTIVQSIQFNIDGEIEQGRTYNFDSTTIIPIITASKTSVRKSLAYGTASIQDQSPTASGSFKVLKYNSETGEIKALFKARVSPVEILKGTKSKVSSKGVSVKATLNTTLK
jgi:hypothetical protein